MNELPSVRTWKNYLLDRGVGLSTLHQYLPYVRELRRNNCPVIFEIEHLSILLGIQRNELAKMINSSSHYYRVFKLPKRRGGFREIAAPYPSLLFCQDWIYKNILLPQQVHDSAHGFVPGRSIFSNAQNHLAKKALLKLDLKDFFPSIPIAWVIQLFASLGYAKNISFYLASLCCLDGRLSQGASTSPYLTNILLHSLDNRLSRLAKSYGLTYTRYADDMAFSGGYIPVSFIDVVSRIITEYGLEVNSDKTRLQTKPGQRIVTGLSVANDRLTIPRSLKREIKQEVYYMRRFGYLAHVSRRKIKNPYYLDSIYGKLQFWRQAESDNDFVISAMHYIESVRDIG